MTKETRLNAIAAGVLLAAFGLVFGWMTVGEILFDAVAFHADTGLHAYMSPTSTPLKVRLVSSAALFVTGVGLALCAALRGVRLK
jgi:hypothetical protein